MAVAWHSQPSHLAWNRRGLSACSGSAGKEDEAALLLPAHLCMHQITLPWGLGDLVLQWGFQREHPARCGQPEVASCPFWSRGRMERSSQGLVLSLHAAGSLAAVTAPFWQLLTPPKRGLREGKAAQRAGGTACLIPSLVPGAPLPLPPPQSLCCALQRSPTALGELQRCQ